MVAQKRSNLVDVGRVSSPFGVKGWLKIVSFTQPKENIVKYSPWWLKTRHGAKPFEVDDYRFRSEGLVVHFKGIDDRDQAAMFNLVDIAVDKDLMPSLGEGEYYWHQLIGMEVFSVSADGECCLGSVKSLLETGANDVLVVQPTENSIDGRERLVPYVPGVYVDSVDVERRNIRVFWDPDF